MLLCEPAKIYLAILVVYYTVRVCKNSVTVYTTLIDVLLGIIWVCVLSILCKKGMKQVAWAFVLLPFVMIGSMFIYGKSIYRVKVREGAQDKNICDNIVEDNREMGKPPSDRYSFAYGPEGKKEDIMCSETEVRKYNECKDIYPDAAYNHRLFQSWVDKCNDTTFMPMASINIRNMRQGAHNAKYAGSNIPEGTSKEQVTSLKSNKFYKDFFSDFLNRTTPKLTTTQRDDGEKQLCYQDAIKYITKTRSDTFGKKYCNKITANMSANNLNKLFSTAYQLDCGYMSLSGEDKGNAEENYYRNDILPACENYSPSIKTNIENIQKLDDEMYVCDKPTPSDPKPGVWLDSKTNVPKNTASGGYCYRCLTHEKSNTKGVTGSYINQEELDKLQPSSNPPTSICSKPLIPCETFNSDGLGIDAGDCRSCFAGCMYVAGGRQEDKLHCLAKDNVNPWETDLCGVIPDNNCLDQVEECAQQCGRNVFAFDKDLSKKNYNKHSLPYHVEYQQKCGYGYCLLLPPHTCKGKTDKKMVGMVKLPRGITNAGWGSELLASLVASGKTTQSQYFCLSPIVDGKSRPYAGCYNDQALYNIASDTAGAVAGEVAATALLTISGGAGTAASQGLKMGLISARTAGLLKAIDLGTNLKKIGGILVRVKPGSSSVVRTMKSGDAIAMNLSKGYKMPKSAYDDIGKDLSKVADDLDVDKWATKEICTF